MPTVDFLTERQVAAFGRYEDAPSQADLEQFFFLDDDDRELVARQRGDHNRLGFSVQLATARYIGRFLPDPLDGVPTAVIDFLAEQVGVADASCGGRPVSHDAELHKERNTVERCINKIKDWRGLATRYDKRPDSYMAGLQLRGAVIWLRSLQPAT
jgi:hypothetical protein